MSRISLVLVVFSANWKKLPIVKPFFSETQSLSGYFWKGSFSFSYWMTSLGIVISWKNWNIHVCNPPRPFISICPTYLFLSLFYGTTEQNPSIFVQSLTVLICNVCPLLLICLPLYCIFQYVKCKLILKL